ncbi:hypothetical protein BDY21DRAFT_48565 [Lineolata rhizophorae]|uniref:Uncharacterized protein n=1 Tax=Lineolata rhizophorae TaxID=578093 RepID=A0A6A6NXY8_9PEZI|nr:hypothetical protein BDY21DRAFT_48565 [Lineolata rhizophorae]
MLRGHSRRIMELTEAHTVPLCIPLDTSCTGSICHRYFAAPVSLLETNRRLHSPAADFSTRPSDPNGRRASNAKSASEPSRAWLGAGPDLDVAIIGALPPPRLPDHLPTRVVASGHTRELRLVFD